MTDIVTRNPPIKPFLDRFWPCGDLRHNRWNFPVSVISNSRGASYQQCLLKRLFWTRAYKTVQQFVQHFYLEADIDSISDPRVQKSSSSWSRNEDIDITSFDKQTSVGCCSRSKSAHPHVGKPDNDDDDVGGLLTHSHKVLSKNHLQSHWLWYYDGAASINPLSTQVWVGVNWPVLVFAHLCLYICLKLLNVFVSNC